MLELPIRAAPHIMEHRNDQDTTTAIHSLLEELRKNRGEIRLDSAPKIRSMVVDDLPEVKEIVTLWYGDIGSQIQNFEVTRYIDKLVSHIDLTLQRPGLGEYFVATGHEVGTSHKESRVVGLIGYTRAFDPDLPYAVLRSDSPLDDDQKTRLETAIKQGKFVQLRSRYKHPLLPTKNIPGRIRIGTVLDIYDHISAAKQADMAIFTTSNMWEVAIDYYLEQPHVVHCGDYQEDNFPKSQVFVVDFSRFDSFAATKKYFGSTKRR